MRVQAGSFGYDPLPRLPGLNGRMMWGLGLTFFPGPPFPSHAVGIDFDVWGVERSYPSIIEGAAEPETTLRTAAFSLGARAGTPALWPLGVYGAAGLTYASHTMEVEVQPAWFLPGIGQHWEEEDGGWGPYGAVGAEGRLGRLALGVERRWIRSRGSFDDPFSIHAVELGGAAFLFTASWRGVE